MLASKLNRHRCYALRGTKGANGLVIYYYWLSIVIMIIIGYQYRKMEWPNLWSDEGQLRGKLLVVPGQVKDRTQI